VWSGIWRAIDGFSNSFAQSEPMSSVVKRLHLVLPGEADSWSLDGVSITEESCSILVSFEYLVRAQWYECYFSIFGPDFDNEPPKKNAKGEPDYYFFDVSALFLIDDYGEVISSEILDICAQDS
jgi:hypothetical protein